MDLYICQIASLSLSLSLSESMDGFLDGFLDRFLDRSPSDDEDPPFPITAPSELDDSENDQKIEFGSATNHLVNSSTNLNPDILLEQQSEPQSPSISFDTKLLCPWLQPQLKLQRQCQLFELQCQLKLQRQCQLEFELQRQLECRRQYQLESGLQLYPELQRQHLNWLSVDERYNQQLGLRLQLYHQLQRQHLNRLSVDERYNQELYYLFNMFHNHNINAKTLDTAWKSLEEKYYYLGTDNHRFIHCGDMAGERNSCSKYFSVTT
ncbi:unnamed protein product [Camellia sinensis]